MTDRRLLVQERDGNLAVHADLGTCATWHCNDMIVDSVGRAYVGNFGFDTHGDVEPTTASLAMVDPYGGVSVAATNLAFPNGTAITPDGKTLIIAESRGRRLTAFDIDPHGSLHNRRLWADIAPHVPDGICLDEAGAIWVADPRGGCVVRVAEGGAISELVHIHGRGAYACMLGGSDGRTLYVCTATGSGPHARERREGRIEFTRVRVPHAGLP